jgi:V8-like Glu-specific endopeptidase
MKFFMILISLNAFANTKAEKAIKVVYGNDDRVEAILSHIQYQELAYSTVALIDEKFLVENEDKSFTTKGPTLAQNYKLCEDVNFAHQPSIAHCSGFLVAKNKIVTAGHCVQQQSDCETFKIVFDYAVKKESDTSVIIPKNSIYGCKEVVDFKVNKELVDYAVITLDRDVDDREPLKINRESTVQKDTSVFVIGHPSGLPTKIADDATVLATNDIFFTADLDTFAVNSGSAVFNEKTLLIEGILARGQTDYKWGKECNTVNQLQNKIDGGEEVTHISLVPGI